MELTDQKREGSITILDKLQLETPTPVILFIASGKW